MRLTILLLLISLRSMATTYYVSNTGSDLATGTSTGTAWQTITKVNASSFSPDDIIQFNGGQSFVGTIIVPSSGTSGHPITFQSYGVGNATITSTGVDGIDITNKSGITIQNLILDGVTHVLGSNGIYASATTNGNVKYTAGLTFTNLEIKNYDGTILIGGDAADNSASGFTNVIITLNYLHDCINFGVGIYANSYGTGFAHSSLSISNNTIDSAVGVAGTSNSSGNGIVIGECISVTITNNVVSNCGANNTCASGPVGIWAYDCTGVGISFNEVYNQKTNSGTDGGGFDIDGGCSGSSMKYNYSHDNYGPGYLMYAYNDGSVTTWDNNTCSYNISVNDGKLNTSNIGSLVIGATSTMTNCYVYNNTVYQSLGTSAVAGFFGASIGSATGYFSNNILYSTSNAYLINTISTNPSALVITGNDYYNTGTFNINWNGTNYTTFASWQTASSKELISAVNVGKTLDPFLVSPGAAGVNNYKIKNNSPVTANGLNLPTLYSLSVGTRDYFGGVIPNSGGNYSIGAHQPARFAGRLY